MSKARIATAVIVLYPLLLAQQTLNNDSVIKLRKAGFSEDVIVSAIHRSPGSYDTSTDGLIALKSAGLTNTEISAIIAKASAGPRAATAQLAPVAGLAPSTRTALPASAHADNKPRVFLRSQSHETGWNASKDQSLEMSKDFQEICPDVQVSVNQYVVDYSVELNHIEHSFVRYNQMQVANKYGDLVSKTRNSGTIKGGVKQACEAIVADWASKTQKPHPQSE
jgi:hypothetical protein